ncbi:MAG: cupredoxin domain-containing protein, partial [Nitrosotalea sp.]
STSDTLTSDGFKESNSFGEIFGGSTLKPGDTYEFTFTKAGTFGYHGVPNSWNKGKVIVLEQR